MTSTFTVPWCSKDFKGLLIMNSAGGQGTVACFGGVLSLLHLGPDDRAQDVQERNFYWLAPQTARTLIQLCGSVIVMAVSGVNWARLSEVKIEHRFGELRGQFSNSKMAVRDYVLATAKLAMRKEKKGQSLGQTQAPDDTAIDGATLKTPTHKENEYQKWNASSQALQQARRRQHEQSYRQLHMHCTPEPKAIPKQT